jgi:uncharacterized protein
VRNDVDHLPLSQQEELARVKQILLDEFSIATARATQSWKKNGKVRALILFGSYSRDDWVDAPETGYVSDYDLLIIVSHPDLTDIADYWYVAEDKILRDPTIGRPVNLIIHTLDEVNQGLTRGEYFWRDIARDGIALYELPDVALATPKPLTAAHAYEMALKYYRDQSRSLDQWIDLVEYSISRISSDNSWSKKAAFNLHQAAETAYTCFLLVRTHYLPRSHNLKFLRSLSEDKEPILIDSWPRETKLDRRRFELAKRAYVEARYSNNYTISIDDLQAINAAVHKLRDIVESVSHEWIDDLRKKAGL